MTLERQKWWDSLPNEEKRVRYVIAYYKEDIKFAKAVLKRHREAYEARVTMQENKQAIKALRKQIAMRPSNTWYDYDDYCDAGNCPRCDAIVNDDAFTDYCPQCGQKLRWD